MHRRQRIIKLHTDDLSQEITVGDTIGPHVYSNQGVLYKPHQAPRTMSIQKAKELGLVNVVDEPDGKLYEVFWTDWI